MLPDTPALPGPARVISRPTRELSPFVKNFMFSGFVTEDVQLPAGLDTQLIVYLRGGATLYHADGSTQRLPYAFVSGPTLEPRRFRVDPGSCVVAATFRSSGFTRCFGVPVNCLGPAPVPLDCLTRPEDLLRMLERMHRARNIPPLFDALDIFIRRQKLLQGRELPFLPQLTLERMLQPPAALAGELGLGVRQLERRFLMHLGVPLRASRRMARLSRAFALMMGSPALSRPADIAHDAGYVDQAHFTRDFRKFVGDTPASFLRSRLEEGSRYRLWQLSSEEVHAFVD